MPIHDPRTGRPDPELGRELFNLVEIDQWFAFISGGCGCEVLSRKEIFHLAYTSLKHARRLVRTLEKFMMKREQSIV